MLHEDTSDGGEARHHAIVFRAKVGTDEVESGRFTVTVRPTAELMALGGAMRAAREAG